MKRLVIVESPTKTKTISKYLPKGYEVDSSMGHIRDLPSSAKLVPAKYKKESWSSLVLIQMIDTLLFMSLRQTRKRSLSA